MSDDAKKKVGYEGEVELGEARSYLEEILEGLGAGAVWVQSGNDLVGLHPADRVRIRVEARRKKEVQRLRVELEWEASRGEEQGEDGGLVISSTEPEHVIVEESEE